MFINIDIYHQQNKTSYRLIITEVKTLLTHNLSHKLDVMLSYFHVEESSTNTWQLRFRTSVRRIMAPPGVRGDLAPPDDRVFGTAVSLGAALASMSDLVIKNNILV